MIEEAIAEYHALLDTNPAVAEESARILAEEQPRLGLTFGDRPLCTVLRPEFLAPETYQQIRDVCRILSTAMFRLAESMRDEPPLLDAMALTPIELDLIGHDPGYRHVSPSTRLDSFLAGATWHFVEYNAETPAAIAYEDVLSELFLKLPVMQEFSKRFHVRPLPARQRLLETLTDAYRQWGGGEDPVIAIVDWSGLPTASEFELCRHYFESAGIRTLIAEPADLSYDGARLRARGEIVNLVYRRVLTSELLAHPEVAEPLLRAYKDHAACIVNSFRSKLLHKKMIFALLSDDRYADRFSAQERFVIANHIPWTRRVEDTSTSHHGRRIDIMPHLSQNRASLVLKPNDEYGGKGVVLGWDATEEEWQSALRDALDSPSVVQEAVRIDRSTFPVWEVNGLVWPELAVDLDPFLFHTEVTGALTRLSAASLLNVTAGTGSVAPTFLVERA